MSDLSQIKVGDTVTVKIDRAGSIRWSTETVIKITPTQIVCGGTRYRKSDGRMIGENKFAYRSLVTGNEEAKVKEAIKRHEIATKICIERTLDQSSIIAMRAAADEAEAWLREHGVWEGANG